MDERIRDISEIYFLAEGYCALTYSYRDKEMIVSYIKDQKEHHKKVTFEDEYRALLKEHGVVVDERYIFRS
jgi:putative transposase